MNVIDLINRIAFGGSINEKLFEIMKNHIAEINSPEKDK